MRINYYEELNIDQDSSVDEIKRTLNQLESTWKRREVNSPEKATKMLSLIIEARKVFDSDYTKKQYDESLITKSTPVNDDEVKKYISARDRAINFASNNQWDLAKVSVDTMLPLLESVGLDENELVEAYKLAVKVYSKNDLYEQMLETANLLLFSHPDVLLGYTAKEIALRKLLDTMNSEDNRYSGYSNNYRVTCSLLNEKAAKQGNTQLANIALYYLSASYINYFPKNYDSAEKIAYQLLDQDPNYSDAKRIIDWLNQPQAVSVEELDRYDSEQSQYEEAILKLIDYITNNNVPPTDDEGWVLSKKSYFGHYNPNKDGFDEEDTTNTTFYLNTYGKIIKRKIYEEEIYFNNGNGLPSKSTKNDEHECPLNDVMIEMDFSGSISYDPNSSFHEHGNLIEYIRLAKYKKNGQSVTLSRIYRKKGQGLYNFLNDIVNKAKKYEEECQRINEKYNTELDPLIEEIERKYVPNIQSIIQERDNRMITAKSNEQRYNYINSQITSLRAELDSLGFFAGKKKKEIQSKISGLENERDSLETVSGVMQDYNKKMNEVELQKNREIQAAESRIRNKYPLPLR